MHTQKTGLGPGHAVDSKAGGTRELRLRDLLTQSSLMTDRETKASVRKRLGGTHISFSSMVPSEGKADSSSRPKSPASLLLRQLGNRDGCLMSLIQPFGPKARQPVRPLGPWESPAVPILGEGRVPSPGRWREDQRSSSAPAS